jgi:hypothetical protein
MARVKFMLLVVSACVLSTGAPELHAATTVIVGTCKPGSQFPTIGKALNAICTVYFWRCVGRPHGRHHLARFAGHATRP